ncbi:hypothetical protein HAX54_009920 [Datura stramonium]|uniref:Uncharacterized protein n=1 Tax=Datura stramonium TaxID=4076 RepID=A0ABS8RX67_DATST|nr:hypothetical protein [Datura stramonium]
MPRKWASRGVKMVFTAKAISMAYFNDDYANVIDYLAKLQNPKKHYIWVASLIAADALSWVTDAEPIYKSDLNIFTPSKNDNEIPPPRVILVTCIMEGVHINMGKIIALEIRDRARLNLDKSVLVLEGIDIGKVVVALRADMGKVKGDILQLHPDFSIFDTPILEEDDLEHERVEKDEEPFEDVHRKKT